MFKYSFLNFVSIMSLSFSGIVCAQPINYTDNDTKLELNTSIWFSDGETTESFTNGSPFFGSPTSRLKYDNIDTEIYEISGKFHLNYLFYISAGYGFGNIDEGELIDQDYFSQLGASRNGFQSDGDFLFSETSSGIGDDDVNIFKIGAGYKFFDNGNTSLDFVTEYKYWNEKYVAQGLRYNVCTFSDCPPLNTELGFSNSDVISNDVEWQTFSIGIDSEHKFSNGLSLTGGILITPYADLQADDIHFLRDDLSQSPSFRSEGDGNGIEFDLGLNYYLMNDSLRLGVGYKYTEFEVEDESNGQKVFDASGASGSSKLDKFKTEREGLYFDLNLEF